MATTTTAAQSDTEAYAGPDASPRVVQNCRKKSIYENECVSEEEICAMPRVGLFYVPHTVSGQARVLLAGFANFYTEEIIRDFLAPTLSKSGSLSFRVINYAVTTFAQRHNLCVVDADGTIVNLYYDYKRKLGKSHRRNFDCFKRWERVYFSADGKFYSSTVGQLHFMRWAHQVRLFELGPNIMDDVAKEMARVGEERRRLQREQAALRGIIYVPKKRGRKPKPKPTPTTAPASATESAPAPASNAQREADDSDDSEGAHIPKARPARPACPAPSAPSQVDDALVGQVGQVGQKRQRDDGMDGVDTSVHKKQKMGSPSPTAAAANKPKPSTLLRKPSKNVACMIYSLPQRISTIGV